MTKHFEAFYYKALRDTLTDAIIKLIILPTENLIYRPTVGYTENEIDFNLFFVLIKLQFFTRRFIHANIARFVISKL